MEESVHFCDILVSILKLVCARLTHVTDRGSQHCTVRIRKREKRLWFNTEICAVVRGSHAQPAHVTAWQAVFVRCCYSDTVDVSVSYDKNRQSVGTCLAQYRYELSGSVIWISYMMQSVLAGRVVRRGLKFDLSRLVFLNLLRMTDMCADLPFPVSATHESSKTLA